jgi:predicted permease
MYAVNGIQRTDIVLPLPLPPSARDNRNGEDFNVFAKLRRGGSVRGAQAELDGIAARMKQQYPQFYPAAGGLTLSAVSLVQQVVGSMRTALYILVGAVGLVLLIACANVANLILSRAASQERDLAVRVAIGASGSQIVGGVMAEGAMLAIAGVLTGLAIAFLSVLVLRAAGPDTIPRLREIVIDWRVLTFTAAVASVALLLFAVPPALRSARVDAGVALKVGARGSQSSEAFGVAHGRLQRFLIVSEVTLATVLLVGAGLLLRSYANIRRADPGFQPKNVTTLRLSLPAQQYKGAEAISRLYDDLARRLRSIPGVTAVGMNYQLPLSSVALAWEPVDIEGYVPKGPGDDRIITSSAYVTADYFRAMGIPLSRGRFFTTYDVAKAPAVVIVDDKFAQRFWPNEDALGKRIRQGADGPWRTVVGVVKNTKEYQPDAQPPITAYFPVDQYAIGSRFIVIRTDSAHDAAELMRQVQREVHASDPQLPIYDAHTMLDRLDSSLTRRRLTMSVLAAFAALALILSAIGLHGVIAYWVGRRRKEIGIRMALGADRRHIAILLAREFGPAIATGVALGTACAVAGGGVVRSLLFGISVADAPNLAAACTVVMVVAVAAIFIPASRAAGTSPALAIQRD